MCATVLPSVNAMRARLAAREHVLDDDRAAGGAERAIDEHRSRSTSIASSRDAGHDRCPCRRPGRRPSRRRRTVATRRSARAASKSSKRARSPIGMPWRRIRSFANAFDDSIRAAAFVGPKARDAGGLAACRRARTRADRPARRRRGRSRALARERDRRRRRTRATSASDACALRDRRAAAQSAICAMPALPGATVRSPSSGDWRSFQAIACSRPPQPIRRTLVASISRPCSARSGEGRG